MRIILVGSVGTVKRLRVSLGTLVAIEATTADADAACKPAPAEVMAAQTAAANIAAEAARTKITADGLAITAAADIIAAGPADAGAAEASAANTAIAESAINRAFEAIELVNRLMHPTAEGSDLARINNAPLHEPTRVHASVGQLLNLARRINTLTDGVFDPCTPAQPGRLGDIQVSTDETEIVCHAPVALDFGGFAKGYAVDCAIEALMASGCTAGLVNAGGDLRVFGRRAAPVFVRAAGGELITVELIDAALAVSDAASPQRPPKHQGYYVRASSTALGEDQRTAAPLAVTLAAVVARTAAIADALTKCVLLCPPAVAIRTLRAFGATQRLLATELTQRQQVASVTRGLTR
jgi:thiamine biosynthesis lipoprotein